MRRCPLLIAALTLGACSASPVSEPLAPAGDHKIWPGPDYKQLVADSGWVATVRNNPSHPLMEISDLKRTEGPQPGDWMTCLRTAEGARLIYYGIFFKGFDISDYRLSVIIDRCEQEQYSPLPTPTPPLKKEIAPNPALPKSGHS
jgi:hypothetical protein